MQAGTAVSTAPRLQLADLNSHLVCVLCRGYLVDATTIVECLHSFCRSCLVRHIERIAACPSCEAPLPKARPFLHIRSDKTLQDIVYKLVPGLYRAEMQRRRHFFAQHPDQACLVSAEDRGEAMERLVFSPEDHFSLSLEYFDPQAERDTVLRTAEDWEIASSRSSESGHEGATPTAEGAAATGPAKRYLQCPALFTVRLLKKFLRNKFELQPNYKIDVIHRRVCLPDDYTLMDVAYIYSWRQSAPMRFFYRIYRDPELILTKKRPLPVSEPVSIEQESLPTPAKQERVEEKKETVIVKEPSPPPREEKSVPPVQPVPENPPAIKVTEPSQEVKPPQKEEVKPPQKEEFKPPRIEAEKPSNGENHVQESKSSTSVECDKSQPAVSTPTKPTNVPEEKSSEVSPSSPSKGAGARPRPPGVNRGGQASILSIAQTLARKQQEQQQARQQREQMEPPRQKAAAAALTPSENKEKFKPIQPKPATLPTDTPPAPPAQKRSHPTKKPPHHASNEMIKQESIKMPGVPKKPRLQEEILRQTLQSKPQQRSPSKQQSSARTRPSPTYPSMSPFAPMHRPPPHPIRIPAPPKQQQRPSSLSSSSSPSPSPPADVSPSSAARLFPQSNSAAATAAAILMQQQLELQSRFLHSRPEWTHPLHHPAAFLPSAADWGHESMKRLENLMRSLGRGGMFPYRPTMPNPAAAAAHAHAASHHAAATASHAARND